RRALTCDRAPEGDPSNNSALGEKGGPASADSVEPADRGAGAGVAEGLELVVPGPAEREVHLVAHAGGVGGELQGRANAVLGDDDVAVGIGLGVEDPQLGG